MFCIAKFYIYRILSLKKNCCKLLDKSPTAHISSAQSWLLQRDSRPRPAGFGPFFSFWSPAHKTRHLLLSLRLRRCVFRSQKTKKFSRGTDRIPGPSRGYVYACLGCVHAELHATSRSLSAFLGWRWSYHLQS